MFSKTLGEKNFEEKISSNEKKGKAMALDFAESLLVVKCYVSKFLYEMLVKHFIIKRSYMYVSICFFRFQKM